MIKRIFIIFIFIVTPGCAMAYYPLNDGYNLIDTIQYQDSEYHLVCQKNTSLGTADGAAYWLSIIKGDWQVTNPETVSIVLIRNRYYDPTLADQEVAASLDAIKAKLAAYFGGTDVPDTFWGKVEAIVERLKLVIDEDGKPTVKLEE